MKVVMRKYLNFLPISFLFLAGCSFDASLMSTLPSFDSKQASTSEVVSFSHQKARSFQGRVVSASSGTPYSQLVGISAQGRYKVFSTVQGHFIANEETTK